MKEYIVSLDIISSPSVTPSHISKLLGVEKSAAITSRPLRKGKKGLLWRFEPTSDETVPLSVQIETLASRIQAEHRVKPDKEIEDIYLSIGVFCERPCTECFDCNLTLPYRPLSMLAKKVPDFDIAISYYPCKELEPPMNVE